jgi:signal transduction histidine kinase
MDAAPDLTLPCLVHDLNNVFQTLVEAADLLSSDPRWTQLAAVIVRSVERGKAITASLQAGSHEGAPLGEIVRHAISFVEDSAGAGPPIRFVCRVEPHIVLRRNWAWERVFINLFSNARRAMPAGGLIEVGARRIADGFEIVVRDDGPGIAPALLAEIFQPGVSTQASAGLGLHIVATIVKQDEGSVRAANRADGRGAEFVITLPAAAADATARAVPARAG